MPHLTRIVFVIAVGTILLIAPAATAASDMARVAKVVDGQTIVVSRNGVEERLHLLGVISPDPADAQGEVSSFGKLATDYLAAYLKTGSWVMIEVDPTVDAKATAGERAVNVYRASDAAFVNRKIVAEGYGIAAARTSYRGMSELKKAEAEARKLRKGIWGDSAADAAKFGAGRDQAVYAGEGGSSSGNSVTWVTFWILRWR